MSVRVRDGVRRDMAWSFDAYRTPSTLKFWVCGMERYVVVS